MELVIKFIQSSISSKLARSSRRNLSISNSLNSETTPDANGAEAERKLTEILLKRFPDNSQVNVTDVSGGCGAMYDVTVIWPEFKGLSIVKQHRMVTETLKEEIKQMHGLRISTHHEPFSDKKT